MHTGPKRHHSDNLKSQERQALASFSTRTDMIIKKADEGLATVLMSHDNYISKVMQYLKNEQHYRKLQEDPTELFSQQIKSFLQEMVNRHSIDKETFSGLLPQKI